MTKKELEAYAALVLIKTTQIIESFSTDWLKDKPDLQISNFGMEVTEAIDEKERHGDVSFVFKVHQPNGDGSLWRKMTGAWHMS